MARSSETEILRMERKLQLRRKNVSERRSSDISLDMPEYSGFSFGEGKKTQFVYFYIHGPDNGMELQLSIISLKKNFPGSFRVTVIGEKPSWYDGHHIPSPRFKGIRDHAARMPFRDTQSKIIACANSDEIDEEFVWIMDDLIMLKPTTIAEMRVPRYDPWYRVNKKTTWHQLISHTFAALKKHGRPNLQYGTHLAHVFTKTNLRVMFDKYGFPGTLLLFEILYQNEYRNPEEAVPYGETWNGVKYPQFLKRLLRPATRQQLDAIDANFLNWQSKCWNTTMKLFLTNKFSEDQ